MIVDGGNSNFRDSQRRYGEAKVRADPLRRRRRLGRRLGARHRLLPDGRRRRRAGRRGSSRSSATSRPRTATRTSAPAGAGHFTKMVHNGIEYGLMQAYAEGFEIMERSEFDLDLEQIAGIWRYGSVVRSWLLDLLHEAFGRRRREPAAHHAATSRTPARAAGRSPRRSRRTCPAPVITRRALRALRLAPGRVVRGQGERRAAQPVRRPRGKSE